MWCDTLLCLSPQHVCKENNYSDKFTISFFSDLKCICKYFNWTIFVLLIVTQTFQRRVRGCMKTCPSCSVFNLNRTIAIENRRKDAVSKLKYLCKFWEANSLLTWWDELLSGWTGNRLTFLWWNTVSKLLISTFCAYNEPLECTLTGVPETCWVEEAHYGMDESWIILWHRVVFIYLVTFSNKFRSCFKLMYVQFLLFPFPGSAWPCPAPWS